MHGIVFVDIVVRLTNQICEPFDEKQTKMIKARTKLRGVRQCCLEKNLCEFSKHQLEADLLLVI
jgi:hypothetical protein